MNKIIIIMGVSGCGKSTIAQLLSDKVDIPFYDADDFHPMENIMKMTKGIPLSDSDRDPWLDLLTSKITYWAKTTGAILACSALKESYRTRLSKFEDVKWVYLKGSYELIYDRMQKRENHFIPADLLQSQFDALEEPTEGIIIDIENKPEVIIKTIQSKI